LKPKPQSISVFPCLPQIASLELQSSSPCKGHVRSFLSLTGIQICLKVVRLLEVFPFFGLHSSISEAVPQVMGSLDSSLLRHPTGCTPTWGHLAGVPGAPRQEENLHVLCWVQRTVEPRDNRNTFRSACRFPLSTLTAFCHFHSP
jgi:hypothetical protein